MSVRRDVGSTPTAPPGVVRQRRLDAVARSRRRRHQDGDTLADAQARRWWVDRAS